MKFLCSADLHLGRRSSIRQELDLDVTASGAWRRMVELALTGRADAVVLAGDVFDGLASSLQERKRFHNGVLRLAESGIPVLAVTGNHDHAALPSYAAAFPHESFILLGLRGWEAREVSTKSGTVCFVGQSFGGMYEHAAASAPELQTLPGVPIIAILHGDMAAGSVYRPIPVSVLDRPADAWILGHLHLPTRVAGAKVPAIYPGSPQALDFGETGVHGVNWLEVDGLKATFSPTIPLSTVHFAVESIDVSREPGEPRQLLDHAVRARARALLPSTPEGGYCALRIHALVSTGETGPMEEPVEGDGFEWQLIGVTVPPSMDDIFRDATDSGAVGQSARLIAGLLADLGDARADGRTLPASWIGMAQSLVARAALEMQTQHRLYLGQAAADQRLEYLTADLSNEEAMAKARRNLLTASLELYRQLSGQLQGTAP